MLRAHTVIMVFLTERTLELQITLLVGHQSFASTIVKALLRTQSATLQQPSEGHLDMVTPPSVKNNCTESHKSLLMKCYNM